MEDRAVYALALVRLISSVSGFYQVRECQAIPELSDLLAVMLMLIAT